MFDSDGVQNLLSSIFDRQNIDLQQELTSVASGDELLVFDVSETGNAKTKKATVANIGTTIAGGGYAGSFSTLTATGLVDISGASAGQIKFPATQNPSSDANTLDDYEEGTWTLGISFGGGSTGITQASGFPVSRYVKVGRVCYIGGVLALTSKGSSTGTALLTGLPFTSNSTTNQRSLLTSLANNLAATINNVVFDVPENVTTIRIFKFASGGVTALTDADFTNTSSTEVGGVYET